LIILSKDIQENHNILELVQYFHFKILKTDLKEAKYYQRIHYIGFKEQLLKGLPF